MLLCHTDGNYIEEINSDDLKIRQVCYQGSCIWFGECNIIFQNKVIQQLKLFSSEDLETLQTSTSLPAQPFANTLSSLFLCFPENYGGNRQPSCPGVLRPFPLLGSSPATPGHAALFGAEFFLRTLQ